MSDLVRSVQVGRPHFSRCCHLFIDLLSIPTMEVGQAINAVTGTQRFGFCFFLSWKGCCLRRGPHCAPLAVVQRFVHFSTDPQGMQQYR